MADTDPDLIAEALRVVAKLRQLLPLADTGWAPISD
jgi:hypothetical protein